MLKRTDTGEAGFTVTESLVAMLLSMIVMASVLGSFTSLTKVTADHDIVSRVEQQARTLLDFMAFDIRMTGSGMPLSQTGFSMTSTLYGNVTLPVLVSSNDKNLYVRVNEKGSDTLLTASFNPTGVSQTLSVFSTANIAQNDIIYVSDLTLGGASGMWAQVNATTATTITLKPGFMFTTGVIFSPGSVVNKVTTINYVSYDDWSGITRDAQKGPVRILANSQFSVSYLDGSGAAMTLPLTAASIANTLSSVRLNVTVRSDRPLSNGEIYTASASQVIALRNLILSR